MRRALEPASLDSYSADNAHEWCEAPTLVAGYEAEDREGRLVVARGVQLTELSKALPVYEHYRRKKQPLTLFFYNLDKTLPSLRELRDAIEPHAHWRRYDVGATLSPPRSSIGYHADDKDVVIVQCQGRRRWRVWDPSVLSPHYREALVRQGSDLPTPPQRTTRAPRVDVEFDPGDALYIPAFHPHEGVTLSSQDLHSVSLSFSWIALCARTFFSHDWDEIPESARAIIDARPDVLYSVFTDPTPGDDPRTHLITQLRDVYRMVPELADAMADEMGGGSIEAHLSTRVEQVLGLLESFQDPDYAGESPRRMV